MNKAQSNQDIPFEDIMLESAWIEVENTFKSAGEVAPLPGFSSRWMARLELERQREERIQAAALIVGNLVIAIGFLVLIGLQFVPSVSSGGLLNLWVEVLSRFVIMVKMTAGVLGTFFRTVPSLVPTSWLVSGFTLMAIIFAVWVSMVRRHLSRQGVKHED
ncbi:MAG: hypothetical protein P8Y68_17945 [Anaerolineales bacterium]|jgi:hypothetical protein